MRTAEIATAIATSSPTLTWRSRPRRLTRPRRARELTGFLGLQASGRPGAGPSRPGPRMTISEGRRRIGRLAPISRRRQVARRAGGCGRAGGGRGAGSGRAVTRPDWGGEHHGSGRRRRRSAPGRLRPADRCPSAAQPGGTQRAVRRRGGEGHQAGDRRRLPGAVAADHPGQAGRARGPGRFLPRPGVPGRARGGRAGDRLPGAPRRPGLDAAAAASLGGRRDRQRPAHRGARGHRRPHQRGRDLPVRGRARLRRGRAGTALRRPAVPAVGPGVDGRGVRRAVRPDGRLA